ncbi:uncharacterized protein LOC141932863 isoform X1 [Strix aluco]|uniref:uncharacterized protein LOC141932863 isoform X1 n=1 Tax=Strix aluco TaxID=111821 RepID=UPI003DA20C49
MRCKLKELEEQQERTKATLERLVAKTADELQEQLGEPRAMVASTGQEQAEAQAACPVCSTDISKQAGQLLQRYEKLQEVVDDFTSRQAVGNVVRQLPGRSQVGRCQHGGLGRGLPAPPQLVVLHCNVGAPLTASQIGSYKRAAWKEIKALMQMSCWH